ncbi:MAG: GAF domain-containing protein, partial [Acidimicrobiales bacterium]
MARYADMGRRAPSPDEEERRDLMALCREAVKLLGASRVSVWAHDPRAGTCTPVAGAATRGSSAGRLDEWAHTSLEDLPPFEAAILERRPVLVTEPEQAGGRMPELARSWRIDTCSCQPVVLQRPLGVLLVEPGTSAASAGRAVERAQLAERAAASLA